MRSDDSDLDRGYFVEEREMKYTLRVDYFNKPWNRKFVFNQDFRECHLCVCACLCVLNDLHSDYGFSQGIIFLVLQGSHTIH